MKKQFNLREITTWLLLGAFGILPAFAAEQPGTLATLSTPRYGGAEITALPRANQETVPQAATGAAPTPAKHHVSKWVWVAVAAAAGVGVGAGVIAGNSQGGKTAAVPTTVTIGTGSGGPTTGAPH